MRYAIISPTFPPESNGLANVAYEYAVRLRQAGHHVTIFTNAAGESASYASDEILNIDVINRFAAKGSLSLLNPLRGDILGYIKALRSSQFDAIIVHAAQNWATDLALIFGKSSVKVYFSHCVSVTEKSYTSWPKKVARWISWLPYRSIKYSILGRADCAVFLGEKDTGPRCRDKSRLRHKSHVILPNPASLSPRPFKVWRRDNAIELLCVAALEHMKGQDRILEALRKLEPGHKYRMTFCGQSRTPFSQELENEAARLPRNISCEFVYGKRGDQLWPYYERANLFLYGSRTECYPLVLADCRGFGLPFISFDSGYISEIPGGRTASNSEEMAALVHEYINNPNDFNESLRKERDLEVSWERNCKLLDNFICSEISKRIVY